MTAAATAAWLAYDLALCRANETAAAAETARAEADSLYAAAVSASREPLPICPVCRQDTPEPGPCWECRRDHR